MKKQSNVVLEIYKTYRLIVEILIILWYYTKVFTKIKFEMESV